MLILSQPQERKPQQRPARQIKRLPGLLGQQLSRPGLSLRQRQICQIDYIEPACCLFNLLHRLALPDREGGPQDLMTAYDLLAAILQDLRIERPMNAERQGNVIKIAGRLKLIEK